MFSTHVFFITACNDAICPVLIILIAPNKAIFKTTALIDSIALSMWDSSRFSISQPICVFTTIHDVFLNWSLLTYSSALSGTTRKPALFRKLFGARGIYKHFMQEIFTLTKLINMSNSTWCIHMN